MKKSTIEKIEKEINEKTKLPNEVKEKIKNEGWLDSYSTARSWSVCLVLTKKHRRLPSARQMV